jgi:hypothetical protein
MFSSPTQHQHLAGPVAALAAPLSPGASHATKPTPTPTASPAPTPIPAQSSATQPAESATTKPAAPPATSSPPQAAAGTLLTSADGNVVASCQPGGAYLISWSPAPGFEADDVVRGPAATASVQFEQTTTELTMAVSCSSGTPVAHLSAGS